MTHDLELQKEVTCGCGLDPSRILLSVESVLSGFVVVLIV